MKIEALRHSYLPAIVGYGPPQIMCKPHPRLLGVPVNVSCMETLCRGPFTGPIWLCQAPVPPITLEIGVQFPIRDLLSALFFFSVKVESLFSFTTSRLFASFAPAVGSG